MKRKTYWGVRRRLTEPGAGPGVIELLYKNKNMAALTVNDHENNVNDMILIHLSIEKSHYLFQPTLSCWHRFTPSMIEPRRTSPSFDRAASACKRVRYLPFYIIIFNYPFLNFLVRMQCTLSLSSFLYHDENEPPTKKGPDDMARQHDSSMLFQEESFFLSFYLTLGQDNRQQTEQATD